MKEFLYYYYGFYPNNIVSNNNYYLVYYKNIIYYLYRIDDVNDIRNKYYISSLYSIFYPFLFNKDRDIISFYNNYYYVLLKKNNLLFNNLINIKYNGELIKLNWKKLWIDRSDYYNQYRGINFIIDESIDYYLGVLEIAISYLDRFDNYYFIPYITHTIFNINEYFNPLYLKIDICERDFGEYLKYLFFNDMVDKNKISLYISMNYRKYNYQLVLIRVIYPNYYFDLIDGNNLDYSRLKNIISKREDFKKYVLFLEEEFSKYCDIKKVLL